MTQTAKQAPAPARTPGARRAGPGEYYFDLAGEDTIMGGPDYSPVFGGCVEGERMIVALMRMPRGTAAEPHSHPNEQWVYVLQGTMDWEINGEKRRVSKGGLVYVPANAVHHAGAASEEDVVFFTVKDASHGLHGNKVPG